MLHRIAPAAIAASLALSVPGVAHADYPETVTTERSAAVSLAHSLQRGQSATYTIRGSQVREGLENTPGNVATFSCSVPYTWEVQSVDDAGLAQVANSLTNPDVSWVVNGEAEPAGGIVDGIRAARLTQRVARDGTVSDASGAIDTREVNPDAGNFLSDAIAFAWIQFPDEPVAIGDSWLQTIPLQLGAGTQELQATVAARYTLNGFAPWGDGEVAVIDADYTITIDGTMSTSATSGRVLRVVGRGQGDGYVLFDAGAGRLREVSLRSGMILTATENSGRRTSQAYSNTVTVTQAD